MHFLSLLVVVATVVAASVSAKAPSSEWKPVPGGYGYVHSDCLYEVPNGAWIEEQASSAAAAAAAAAASSHEPRYTVVRAHQHGPVVLVLPPCPHPRISAYAAAAAAAARSSSPHAAAAAQDVGSYDGWLAYTQYKSQDPNGFYSMLNLMSVPGLPSVAPEVLYLFPGLQNDDWVPIVDPEPDVFDIIQPVLQYPADTSNGWGLKSWYVTLNSNVLYSQEIPAPQNSKVMCNMTRTGDATWYIGGAVAGQNTFLTVTNVARLTAQPWAFVTEECYGCEYGGCQSEFPESTPVDFTNILLRNSAGHVELAKWVNLTSPNPLCNEHAIPISSAHVKIFSNGP